MFCLELFCIYSFLCICTGLLNVSLHSFDSFALSSFDKVTIGTQGFASVIEKVEAPTKLDSTQFGSHKNEISTLQLINNISNNLQNLLKYFIGTAFLHHFCS